MTSEVRKTILSVGLAIFLGYVRSIGAASVTVTVPTWHNDNSRDGVNSSETILNTTNVNTTTFGKLYSLPVDGQIYAQPLYVPSVAIPTGQYQGTHNVLFVVTLNNTVFAFDADSSTPTVLWQTTLGTPVPCAQLQPNCNRVSQPAIGILSTPVIDVANGSIFVVAQTAVSSTEAEFALHSLNIVTGLENAHSPVIISGQVAGTGYINGSGGRANGTLLFDPNMHLQRTALTLLRGNVYFGFGAIGDLGAWHGWLFGYNETSLAQVVVKCMSPNFYGNGIWQGSAGFATDNSSNLYFTTGNGDFNASTGGTEWGEALIKMNAVTNSFTTYFVPSNEGTLDFNDLDISAVGPIVLPGASPLIAPMIVSGGKDGRVFLLNSANLKGYNGADQTVQEFQSLTNPNPSSGQSLRYGGSVFYNNTLYTWGTGDVLKSWAFSGASFSTSRTLSNTGTFSEPATTGSAPSMSLSSNGTAAGTAILWTSNPVDFAGKPGDAGTLRAYNASNLATELWDSDMNGTLDSAGSWSRWAPPTIANGKVYVATLDGDVVVYGLLAR